MFKKYSKTIILTCIITLLPILLGIILWDQLPNQLPFHWGIDCKPDQYASRPVSVFVMPIILVFLQLLCVYITGLDKRNKNQNTKIMNITLWIVPFISLFLNGFIYFVSIQNTNDTISFQFLPIFFGALFMLIGNYIPKCTHNHTIGIRIKWTLQNEQNWYATHRFAGKVWLSCGFLLLLGAFLPNTFALIYMFSLLMIMVVSTIIYSYLYHRKQSNK